MRAQSVRDLKQELAAKPVAPSAVVEALSLTGAPVALARSLEAAHTRPVDQQLYSLGIAPGPGKRDFRLGVRIHTTGAEAVMLAERLRRGSKGECDIRYVPEVSAGPQVQSASGGAWFRKRRRPLEAGLSCGHHAITAGTLGFVVEDADAYYVLSNNHVLADVNAGTPGDLVLSPGPTDGGVKASNVIGVLDRYVPISFQRANLIDAAIAELFHDQELYMGWTEALPGRVTGQRRLEVADLGTTVAKVGRTTGVTRGLVTQVEIDRLMVNMGTQSSPRHASFSDQFEVVAPDGPFSLGGDSGSVIIDEEGHACGLLFAGGPDEEGTDLTFANHLDSVLAKLGVELAV